MSSTRDGSRCMTAVSRAAAVAAVALSAAAAGSASYAGPDDAAHRVFTIRSTEITESSSLVVSTTHEGLAYTANDSGDAATIYVLDTSTGGVVGRTSLVGAETIDVEAMGGGADGSLVVADIGDNEAERDSVAVYRVEQPGRGIREVVADGVELTYADGPRDAEAVLYDAASGRIFVISKQTFDASIYATPRHVFGRDRAVLRPVAGAPSVVTDATFLPGDELAVARTYVGAVVYRYPGWKAVTSVGLPPQQQGESIAAPPGGRAIWVGSEGLHSDVLAVKLPPRPPKPAAPGPPSPPAGSETPTPTPTSAGSEVPSAAGDGWGTWAAVWSVLGVGVAAGLMSGWLLRRRDRAKR